MNDKAFNTIKLGKEPLFNVYEEHKKPKLVSVVGEFVFIAREVLLGLILFIVRGQK